MNNLTLDVENEVAVLTINRPKALNALNSETLDELTEVLTEIEGRDDIKVFMAHTDTVFPDLEPMPFKRDEEYMHCPGISDDTASLVIMMMVARYIAQNNLKPDCGILIVANLGEMRYNIYNDLIWRSMA